MKITKKVQTDPRSLRNIVIYFSPGIHILKELGDIGRKLIIADKKNEAELMAAQADDTEFALYESFSDIEDIPELLRNQKRYDVIVLHRFDQFVDVIFNYRRDCEQASRLGDPYNVGYSVHLATNEMAMERALFIGEFADTYIVTVTEKDKTDAAGNLVWVEPNLTSSLKVKVMSNFPIIVRATLDDKDRVVFQCKSKSGFSVKDSSGRLNTIERSIKDILKKLGTDERKER